jgi:DNA-binding FrmR family transcriptional regulator
MLGAAELLFLAGLTTVPRFRAAIDAKVYAEKRGQGGEPQAQAPATSLSELLHGLDPKTRARFDELRTRCLEMQRIAHGVRAQPGESGKGDEIRAPALDRLLWSFLRLLYSQQALQRFLASTDEKAIQNRLTDLKARQAKARERSAAPGDDRIIKSLSDSIVTSELRLENYTKAVSNAEFVAVELDRIEGKIQALTEMAVSHQDSEYISSQVDSVADSMTHTEDAIRELNQITGLNDQLNEAPAILNADLERA